MDFGRSHSRELFTPLGVASRLNGAVTADEAVGDENAPDGRDKGAVVIHPPCKGEGAFVFEV